MAAVGAVVSAQYAAQLDQRLGDRLPASSQAAVQEAKRRTFGVIAPGAIPPAQRAFAANASASASEDAFHLAMGIGAGLLMIAGIGGLALRTERRTESRRGSAPAASSRGRRARPPTASRSRWA